MNNLLNKEYNRYVSIDAVPENSICERCKKTAIHRCLVTGGIFHCQTGVFCGSCGEKFACHIERVSIEAAARAKGIPVDLFSWMYRVVRGGTLSEQGVCKADGDQEGHEEEIDTWEDFFLRWVSGRYA